MRPTPLLIASVLVLPIAVEIPGHPDSGATTAVSIAAGGGTFALIERGCNGEVLRTHRLSFADGGAAVEHRFAGPVGLGVRGGAFRLRGAGETAGYISPHASLDWRAFGIAAGHLFSGEGLYSGGAEIDRWKSLWTGHVRIGVTGGNYLLVRIFEDVPIASKGGYGELGFGFRPNARVRGYMGMSVGPYDSPGFLLQAETLLRPDLSLDAGARLGSSGGIVEDGIAIGFTYRTGHDSRTRAEAAAQAILRSESSPRLEDAADSARADRIKR